MDTDLREMKRVQAQGKGFDLGFFVGFEMREVIRRRVSEQLWIHEAKKKYEDGHLRNVVDGLASTARNTYPECWEEIRGISEGSRVEFLFILLINLQREMKYFVPEDSERAKFVREATRPDTNCTDVAYRGSGEWWLCHNEDGGDDSDKEFLFMLEVKHERGTFVGLTYAGELPSSAFGFNSSGLVFTMDGLSPMRLDLEGVPRNFVSRSLMEATSIQEAIQIISQVQHSVGHSYNIVSTARGEEATFSVEAAPRGQVSVNKIESTCFYHANRYLRLRVPEIPNPSSEHREKRVEEMLPVDGLDPLLCILADRSDASWPIFDPHGTGSTYCTSVFDLVGKRMEILVGDPRLRIRCYSENLW